jgi:hypothetical protein
MNTAVNSIDLSKRRHDWKNLVQEWLTSGQSVTSFCNERKLIHATFYYWRAKFDLAYKSAKGKLQRVNAFAHAESKFVPVQLQNENDALKQKDEQIQDIIFYYPNGCYLRLKEGFSLKILRTLNEVMGV